MPKLKLKHRWIKARPGSVLILVIALLVLLALIGTAYLSSTQGERYSSVQNSINTEADLLIQGLQTSVNSQIAGGLYVGSSYRPPQQEMPTYSSSGASKVSLTGYFNYDSAVIDPNLPSNVLPPDLFLGDRIPVPASGNSAVMLGSVPVWNSISWPLFTDPSGNYTFDSPIDASLTTFLAVNKGKIQAVPTYTTVNGTNYPAMVYFVPSTASNLTLLQTSPTSTVSVSAPGEFLTPTGLNATTPYYYLSASASGDGIADAGLFKIPVGPIDGITYYGAIRVLDGNSAINISSAYTQGVDTVNGTTNSAVNYGFFRSNIGLEELLNTNDKVLGIRRLNSYRFPTTFSPNPVPDSTYLNPPTNFSWYSLGDEIDNELTRRAGNPAQQYTWFGQSATAALGYKYSLVNANTTPSTVESSLAGELLNSSSTPWSPAQVGGTGQISSNTWYFDNFYFLNNYTLPTTVPGEASRLRTVLVGNNAVSNAVPARYGNASSTPTAWNDNAGTTYQFGDWVVDGPAGHQRSFVCIQPHTPTTGNEPEPQPYTYPSGAGANTSFNAGALGYWAGAQGTAPSNTNSPLPGVPWSTVPIKTSVNTATFEQLWLAFAQVMTDSIGVDTIPTGDIPRPVGTLTAQWQPPMQPVAVAATKEQQMGQFRSVIRDSHADGLNKTVLSSSQMLKLRAAIAAVNTMDLRDSDDNVTSAHIVLTDGTTTTTHWYDVEVYGTEKQPYISEVVIQSDGSPYGSGHNYIAVELCNPYMKAITLTGWQIGSMNRTAFPTMALAPGLAIPTVTIPAATANGVPGLLILEDGTRPPDVATTITQNQTAYPAPEATAGAMPTVLVGLYSAAVNATNQANEIFLMRPRLITGPSSSSGATNDIYTEVASTNLADFVPVDQLDLTNLAIPPVGATPGPPVRFLYRRANDGTTAVGKAFHCVYPGFYDPTNSSTMGRYFNSSAEAGSAIITDSTATQPCFLAGPTGGASMPGQGSTYPTLPIELNNVNMGGPHPIASAGNSFPYGQFARNADMLQIPFIGAYRIRPYTINNSPANPEAVTELNSVTIDSTLANDNTASTYALPVAEQPSAITAASSNTTAFYEQIGRFCPVGDVNSPTSDPSVLLDFGPGYAPTDLTKNKVYWHYHWAKKLFDYLTVQAPSDDYYPNVNPVQASGSITPVPVANTNSAYANAMVAGHAEDTTGVEGQININTAPAAVLAQLPLTGTATVPSISTNMAIANAIVAYRNQYGPFQSILDLYRVPKFMNQNEALITTAAGPAQGVFSPGGIGTGAATPPSTVRFDFQERFLLLNNISNLITTRSDTFTCYVLLQGWRNVGTGNPTLVVQRRLAFLADRNGVTPSNNQPVNLKFPSD